MTAVLVTGMSGVGKSTVLAELARRGHRVVDTDHDGWIVETPQPDGGSEPLWDEARMPRCSPSRDPRTSTSLSLAASPTKAGCIRSFARWCCSACRWMCCWPASPRRHTNDFGKSPAERDKIIADVEAIEPLLRAGATLEIDTRASRFGRRRPDGTPRRP